MSANDTQLRTINLAEAIHGRLPYAFMHVGQVLLSCSSQWGLLRWLNVEVFRGHYDTCYVDPH